MNPNFFKALQGILAEERLDAYRQDGADPSLTLARYCQNMALCESLYPTLQFAEIALRNAIHHAFSERFGTSEWFDVINGIPDWQARKISEAKDNLLDEEKDVTPGRMVAEMSFGFWTGFFNKFHARSGIGHYLARSVFRHADKSERDLAKLDARWVAIRELRNRVFHHERIIHWSDLEHQHDSIFEIIAWISPELCELSRSLDRFLAVRKAGIKPWKNKLLSHWPENASQETSSRNQKATIHAIPAPFDASNGAETPFGHRWGGDILEITEEHLMAIQSGQTLLLDIQSEYVAFLKKSDDTNLKGLGYGG